MNIDFNQPSPTEIENVLHSKQKLMKICHRKPKTRILGHNLRSKLQSFANYEIQMQIFEKQQEDSMKIFDYINEKGKAIVEQLRNVMTLDSIQDYLQKVQKIEAQKERIILSCKKSKKSNTFTEHYQYNQNQSSLCQKPSGEQNDNQNSWNQQYEVDWQENDETQQQLNKLGIEDEDEGVKIGRQKMISLNLYNKLKLFARGVEKRIRREQEERTQFLQDAILNQEEQNQREIFQQLYKQRQELHSIETTEEYSHHSEQEYSHPLQQEYQHPSEENQQKDQQKDQESKYKSEKESRSEDSLSLTTWFETTKNNALVHDFQEQIKNYLIKKNKQQQNYKQNQRQTEQIKNMLGKNKKQRKIENYFKKQGSKLRQVEVDQQKRVWLLKELMKKQQTQKEELLRKQNAQKDVLLQRQHKQQAQLQNRNNQTNNLFESKSQQSKVWMPEGRQQNNTKKEKNLLLFKKKNVMTITEEEEFSDTDISQPTLIDIILSQKGSKTMPNPKEGKDIQIQYKVMPNQKEEKSIQMQNKDQRIKKNERISSIKSKNQESRIKISQNNKKEGTTRINSHKDTLQEDIKTDQKQTKDNTKKLSWRRDRQTRKFVRETSEHQKQQFDQF